MIYNYFENEKKLLYYEHGADEIPAEIIEEFSEKDVTCVDFSSNSLVSLDCISHFKSHLQEVIFDNNFVSDATRFPKKKFPNIVVLTLNNNKLADLNQLIQNLVRCFPNVRYLSLLGNKLCPALKQDYSDEDYRMYRLSIISRLTKLKFLDARPVDNLERLSAMQVTNLQNNHQSPQSTTEARMEKFGSIKKFFGFTRRPTKVADEPSTELLNTYSPLPDDNFDSTQSTPKSFYGKVKSHYEGTQSQGNRFILNQDL